ncbi:energy transducer TonB [Aliifodinibius sp. S!AR15-10]|uniref:energy transducer TonB n=1 Tax=Aliifodinibius sp. S!AR15-10 TaxID=2950437 RepID=UPI0028603A17|nr:energy transducer TonB [Aliifodinibius sp. S!AR15-10]MDR8392857.1 energy transducer TonB [Aliifodinibius sp. S!AR15-10]
MINKLNTPGFQDSQGFLRSILTILFVALFAAPVVASAGVADDDGITIERPGIEVQLDSAKVYKVVDTMPEIVGGLKEIYKHIEYPSKALNNNIEGRVFIRFTVDEDGNATDPEVMRDIGGGCGQAAIDAIKEIKFTPGKHKGQVVKVQYGLPINFKIQR